MKKFLTLILILILSLLTCGFAGCGETQEEDNQVEPYVIATFYAIESYNTVTGMVRQVSAYGAQPYIIVKTPELEGWYVTFSSDNEKMLTVDADGRCEVWSGGTCYVTVTYTNGVDKVCDIVSMYNTHWNRDIELYFRAPGLDPTGDNVNHTWSMNAGEAVELTPLLVYSAKMFYDTEIRSVTSTDESVVAFEDGKLVPKKAGTATVVIDCTWRGLTSTSYGPGGNPGTGSADLKRTVTVIVNG